MAGNNLIPMAPTGVDGAAVERTTRIQRVVCGTDFSDGGAAAADVAAEFARRLGEPLTLVHAVNEPSRGSLPEELRESLALFERKQLHDEKERVIATGVPVSEHIDAGAPHEVLIEAANEMRARLLVLSCCQRKAALCGLLGSVAERVAEGAPVPTLIVRSPQPLLDWLRGRRALRLFIAADLTPPSEAAILWALWLRTLGRCTLTIAHIESEQVEPGAFHHYGSPSLLSVYEQVRRTEARCFRQRVRKLLGDEPARIRVASGWGHSDANLIHLAREERADLIVTGTHQREGFDRLVHHSVSRGLLHYASVNVACVPSPGLLSLQHPVIAPDSTTRQTP